MLLYKSFLTIMQQKNKLETVQWKKPRKWNVIKHIYKQFVQVSGLRGPQFLSYAIMVYRFGAPIWPPEIKKKTSGVHFL